MGERAEEHMPNMTDATSGLAHSIAVHRRDRAEAATLRRKATNNRSTTVASQLRDAGASRAAAAGDYRIAAAATNAQRARIVETLLALYRRARLAKHGHRLKLAGAQRRQLAAFMTDLTAGVGALRDGFRTELNNQRGAQHGQLAAFMTDLTAGVGALRDGFRADQGRACAALKATADAVHRQLDEAARDRHGAGEAWRGREPTPPARPAARAADRPLRTESSRPAETARSQATETAPPRATETEPARAAEPTRKVAAPTPMSPATSGAREEAPAREARPHAAPPPPPSLAQARRHGGSPSPRKGGRPS
jgi:hypothetical protein